MSGGEAHVVRIRGLAIGGRTAFDGKWLVEYDPTRPSVDPDGRPTVATIRVTDDLDRARRFFDLREALHYCRRADGRRRALDGRPNRPITAFNLEFLTVERARVDLLVEA